MAKLKIVGGPRNGDTYNAPDGIRELGYFGQVKIPYIENGITKYAMYKRAWTVTPQKTKRLINELHFIGD